ncbi:ribonuclease HII, partial [Candidatus Woesearchaeota archaeon]|nr:ribonuclease HII [Candidatus Woesearchaeota archaeon]
DEAGRGPVLGPLVMAACAIEEKELHKLVELGVKDSKLLTPDQREAIAKEIHKICKVRIEIVPPNVVDEAVNSKKDNLNHLEARTTAKLLHSLSSRLTLTKAILDCPSINIKKYTQTMRGLLKREIPLQCEHKADFKYPIVAAASIIAKVNRDAEMKRVSKLAGADVGSGYMTDPKTHSWLQKNFDGDFGFLRRSWAPIKRLLSQKSQRSLLDFEKKEEHKQIIAEFDKLQDFGFKYIEPKGPYEIIRMAGPENVTATIIKFTTGKILVQGSEDAKKKANALLQTVGLL